jgi:hypothetical protein
MCEGYVDLDGQPYLDERILPKISPEGVRRYLLEGQSIEVIAKAFGVGTGSMRLFIKQHNLGEVL